jgi:hypothetical protein
MAGTNGLVALAAALVVIALGSSSAGAVAGAVEAPQAGANTKVGCWNSTFPFEPGGPDFFARPLKCLWFKRKADTYAEGALLGKELEWRWAERHATAEGRLKLPGTGRQFGDGRVRLLEPVESCGRVVFSRLRYRVRGDHRMLKGGFPIYTCRSSAEDRAGAVSAGRS